MTKRVLLASFCLLLAFWASTVSLAQSISCAHGLLSEDRFVVSLKSPADLEQFLAWAAEFELRIHRRFPRHTKPEQAVVHGEKTADLSLIYTCQIPQGLSSTLPKYLRAAKQCSALAWAEPLYAHQLLSIPNDPQANPASGGQSNYLSLIRAYDAWNITAGDTSVKIGVIDTGLNTSHEDLTGTIAYNEADPINGVDDDQNGYVDDYFGWNFFNDNNNLGIAQGSNGHGQTVASIIAAQANNGRGLAGIAHGTRFVPVVMFGPNNASGDGYAAIVYAADRGCKVINLSWGRSTNNPSEYERTIIRYAAVNKNSTLVAAAGNTPAELDFLPASYPMVLSVAYTDYSSNLDPNATWSTFVDLSAPGQNVMSINAFGAYAATASGSSFSAPMVAAAIGMVKTLYPQLTALQAAEVVRVNTDDNRFQAINQNRYDKIGSGRLNIVQALQRLRNTSMRVENIVVRGKNSGTALIPGDTALITFDVRNYLTASLGGNVTVTVTGGGATVLNGTFPFGAIPSLSSVNNQSLPLTLRLPSGQARNQVITLLFRFTASGYTDFQSFKFVVNPAYYTLENNRLGITYANNARIGYADLNGTQGQGIRLDDQFLVGAAGVLLPVTATQVPNNIIDTSRKDDHFLALSPWQVSRQSAAATQIITRYTDSLYGRTRPRLSVVQTATSYTAIPAHRAHVLEFEVQNQSSIDYDSVGVALFHDWDIQNFRRNVSRYDSLLKIGYTYSLPSSVFNRPVWAGVQVLGGGEPQYFASDLDRTVLGTNVNFNGGFSLADKFRCSMRGILRPEAGERTVGLGNDVAAITGVKIRNLRAGERKRVALAVGAGYSYQELTAALGAARTAYTAGRMGPAPTIAAPSVCAGSDVFLTPQGGSVFRFYATHGLNTPLAEGRFLLLRNVRANTTVYITNADSLFESAPTSVTVNVVGPQADFEMTPSRLILSQGNTVNFSNRSISADQYFWDFDNGQTSTQPNPQAVYTVPGVYNIKLISRSTASVCSDTLVLPLRVWATTSTSAALATEKIQVMTNATAWLWNKDAEVILTDAAGRILHAGKGKEMNHERLAQGVYLLKLHVQGHVSVHRVLKQ